MVLQKNDKGLSRKIESRGAARPALPKVALALIEEAVLRRGDELARPAAVIAVIGLAPPGQRDHRAVMEIIVPQRVEPVSALLRRASEASLLRFVLADHQRRAALSGPPHLAHDRGQDMVVRPVEDRLRR